MYNAETYPIDSMDNNNLDPHGEDVVERIKTGKYDTAPFNRTHLIPPFYQYREAFVVAPTYHLSSCKIEKVMTTITDAIFCYLTNTTEFLADNRTISTEEYHIRFCLDQNMHVDYEKLHSILGDSAIEYAVVRHPIERFLSGFIDKCINEAKKVEERCFGCKGDMECFVQKLYSAMVNVPTTNSTEYDYEVAHFAPQTWYCNFKDHLHHYVILKFKEGAEGASALAKEHETIYRQAGVPDNLLKEIYAQLLVGGTRHSTSGTAARVDARNTLMDNKSLLLRVTQMYYYDFVVFNFSLPILV
ncbi:hypothetical protein Y032_0010g1126 [Ancylostoma ceylanicum]|uniref:Uncharacterized protein n=1 Tax=Ancylostoma ceylanicum TaxID=53326 RepID=A0A016VGF7_9BILA|nr:hypothetical protein Y032_0010g1126 [Ancylostoma ceylanicum]